MKVARPPLTASVPIVVPESLNTTVPVGVDPETQAVKTVVSPYEGDDADDMSKTDEEVDKAALESARAASAADARLATGRNRRTLTIVQLRSPKSTAHAEFRPGSYRERLYILERVIERLIGRPLHYAWLMMIVTFVTLITTAGFRATPGVLIVPLQQEYGWSRGTISLAIAIGLVMFGLAAPFAAALMDRFGMRRVMLIALVTIATGASLTTIMNASWQLDLLWGVVVGGATGAVSVPLAATVANRWFSSNRGLVTGILTASNASGQMIFLPALAWLVTNHGWRWAAIAVAVVAMVLVFPIVAIVVRDRPQSIGLEPYGATEPVPVPERSEHPFRPAIDGLLLGVKSRTFWLLSATFFICGLSTNGLIGTH